MRLFFWILIGLAGWGAYNFFFGVTHAALAPNPPLQSNLAAGEVPPWTCNSCTFTALARYDITARILHRCDYPAGSDSLAIVCPTDFALGWGRMSDPTVYNKLEIGQISRHYAWEVSPFNTSYLPPIPEDEISCSSANTHVIPANAEIGDRLSSFTTGDVIKLSGYLVYILGPNWECRSSLVRTDTGDGACEVMWVSEASKVGR